MARQLCRFVVSIVLATMLTMVATASASQSQRFKVGGRLTVTLTESKPINYRISATVVDILPNGVLVIGVRKSDAFDNYLSVYTLSGKVDPKRVSADGCVLSENIADLTIEKHVIHLYDCIGPF
jgi:flagellar L-ring protein FlgH